MASAHASASFIYQTIMPFRSLASLVRVLAVLLAATGAIAAQTVTFNSLLQEMADRDAVAKFPSPAYLQKQGSTYHRSSVSWDQPDQSFGGWYGDGDGVFCIRTETNLLGATEYVVMEHAGPGAITKLWTPFFYYDFNNRRGAKIRIYLNGSTTPVIDEYLIELVTRLEWNTSEYGAKPSPTNSFTVPNPISAFTARAGDCYLPIPYSNSCKVTMSAIPFYDIVSYRAYEPGTVVENWSTNLYNAASNQAQLTLTAQQIASPTNFSGGTLFQTNGTLTPGGALRLNLNAGTAAVRHFEVQVNTNQIATNLPALRSTVLVMNFDGSQTVWCPLGDFFSSTDSLHPFDTLTRSVSSNGQMVCRWVMPYQTSASLTLTNLGTNTIDATLLARTGSWTWNSNSMHFHANWRPDDVVPGSPPSDWNFIDIAGKGVFVGDAWTVGNIQGGWWGEGDEKIYVDGDYATNKFPSMFGTGTEDYYGWAGGVVPTRTDEFSTPFLSNVRVGGLDGGTMGYNICVRHRGLDAIPFNFRLKFDMESSFGTDIRNPWNVLGYSAAMFWYAVPGATDNRPPMPTNAAKPILSMAQLTSISQALQFGTLTNIAPGSRWNLGEQDSGAVTGGAGAATTKDAVGVNDLTKVGSPNYTNKVPPGGSTLAVRFNGGSYYRSDSVSTLAGLDYSNFKFSLDAYPTANPGYNAPMSLGLYGARSSFFYLTGGTWHYNMNGGGDFTLTNATLNAWTHLEFRREGSVNSWFINGVQVGPTGNTQMPSGPIAPVVNIGGIARAANNWDTGGDWRGLVDNVVVQNLQPAIASGPTLVPNFGSVPSGGTFSLTVLATGEAPLTHFWRQNGVVVTNTGVNSGVIFSNAVVGQSGNYDVIVSNSYGIVTSTIVAVSVVFLPQTPAIANALSATPTNGLLTGASFTLSASGVTGDSPITFLWRRNGSVVRNTGPGSSVTFNNVATNQSGSYDLVLTNLYGAATSSVVSITITEPPVAPPGTPQAAHVWYRLGEADAGAVAGGLTGTFTVDEVRTNNLTRFGTPTYSSDVWTNGGSLSMAFAPTTTNWFTGTNLNIYSTLNLSNFSCEFDAKPTDGTSYRIAACFGRYGGNASFIYHSGGTWRYHIGGIGDPISGGTVALNQWQHMAFVRSNGVNRLYQNDTLLGTSSSFPTPASEFSIGAARTGGGTSDGLFAGLIDNVIFRDLTSTAAPASPALALQLTGGQVAVNVTGSAGFHHTLWRTLQLAPASWIAMDTGVSSASGQVQLSDPAPPATGAFFRVSVP